MRCEQVASPTTSICATTRPGRIASCGITAAAAAAWLVVTRDTRTHEIPTGAARIVAARRVMMLDKTRAPMAQPFRLASGGLIDRARRCASASTAAR